MFKSKTIIGCVMLVIVLALMAPIVSSAMDSVFVLNVSRSGYWTCANIPMSYCMPTTRIGCSGDVWWYSSCYMYCKSSNTSTPRIDCFYPPPPAPNDSTHTASIL
ncbi:MAG: hypothetical protein GY765_28310 [bacterium]|nr:hypothetical protein [bacterium]